MPKAAIARGTPPKLILVKTKGQRLLTPLEEQVQGLVVKTEEDLTGADELLAGIRRARKQWADMIEPVLAPLREAKSAADALNREIDRPLGELEESVKGAIRLYRVEEQRQISEAKRLQDQEAERLREQINETATREQSARTKQMRERLALKREALESQAEEQAEEPEPVAVTVTHSQTRKVKRWRLMDKAAALKAAAAGTIPSAVFEVSNSAMAICWRESPEVVAQWPGFEVYEDIIIAGR